MEQSEFVKRARMKLALNQIEFGKILGRERSAIIRYEQGDDVPPAIMLAIKQLVAEHESRKGPMSKATAAKLEVLHARQKKKRKKRK